MRLPSVLMIGLLLIYGVLGMFAFFDWTSLTEKDKLVYQLGQSVRQGSTRTRTSSGGGLSFGK